MGACPLAAQGGTKPRAAQSGLRGGTPRVTRSLPLSPGSSSHLRPLCGCGGDGDPQQGVLGCSPTVGEKGGAGGARGTSGLGVQGGSAAWCSAAPPCAAPASGTT